MNELMHQWIFYLLTKHEEDIPVTGQKLPIGTLYRSLHEEVNPPDITPPIHKKGDYNSNGVIVPYHTIHVDEMTKFFANSTKYWYEQGYFRKQKDNLNNLWKMNSLFGMGQKSAHQHTRSYKTFGYLFVYALSIQNRLMNIQAIHEYLHSADILFFMSLSHY
jgi:hypothetical protein